MIPVPSLSQLFSFVAKFGGAGLAAYGVQINSIKDMTVGAAFAAIIHFIDSTWNSPKGVPPTSTKPPTPSP